MRNITKWVAGAALVIGSSIGWAETEASASPQTDAYGCFYDASAPAWESETTDDGLCHSGPNATDVQGSIESGVCKTFVGGRTVLVCVPDRAPSGALVSIVWEDGSAEYGDGSVFDPDALNFR